MRWSRSIGVLSLQNREIHEYSRLEIEILETVAMVLSEMIVSEEMTEYKKSLIKARGLASRERVKGLSLSKGYGIGKRSARFLPKTGKRNSAVWKPPISK